MGAFGGHIFGWALRPEPLKPPRYYFSFFRKQKDMGAAFLEILNL
jgi:hypothetical protein